ncbi:ABC transporter substrate-binding protein [Paenibacillus turpanensis]|uniref:ABC transporter substrate-binding protein n=1 Tax=Paenibacillus turpanensis TaxID=2689078 RepID=UPI00140888BB|nr:ABC transporter substrate-binding protein [Paenibacillus turpanensis]
MEFRKNRVRRWMRSGIAAALVGMLLVLSACGQSQESAAQTAEASTPSTGAAAPASEKPAAVERKVTDELGNEVVIPAEPKRVFAPYLEDSLLKLGVTPIAQWANGSQGHAYLQDQLKDVPKLDFSAGQPSPEVVMAQNPDFIILHTATYAANGAYEKYAKIAPTYVFKNASGNVEQSLTVIGELLGKTAEADKALTDFQQKVKVAKEKLDKAVPGKKAAILRFAAKGVSLMGGNYLSGYVLHEYLGVGKSKLVEKENSANISIEVLPEIGADYIFTLNAYGQGDARIKEMTESAVWKGIPAVKEGRVIQVDEAYWLGSGFIAYEKIIDDIVKFMAP